MSPILRLARLILADPERARAEAQRIEDTAKAKRRRVLAKSRPRREAERSATRQGWEKMQAIREAVFARAQGRCEACFVLPPLECHHVISGSERRAKEAEENCAAICRDCHRAAHCNDLGTLSNLRSLMMRVGTIEAVGSLTRRIDKIRSRTP